MRGFIGLTKRNIKVFFKDKQSVIFSLLTSIIVLVLYLLFLKKSFVDGMNIVLDDNKGLIGLVTDSDINMYANLILLVGILGSALITVPYNCLTIVLRDKENKIDYDILATPIKRGKIILSYFVASAFSAILLSSVILSIGLIILRMQGDLYLGVVDILALYGIVSLGAISATAFFMVIVLSFKTVSASGAFFGILSSASGFVIGAYIPVSEFSNTIQTVCNIFPASQVTMLLRNKLMNGLLDHMNTKIGGMDNGLFVDSIKEIFTFKAHIGDWNLEVGQMTIYILISILICLGIQVVLFSKTYKKR